MGIVLARIDNRLLHGIVATQWAGRSGAQRIMIIDDTVANNELTKASMKLARPTGMAISIITEETALNNFKPENTMTTLYLSWLRSRKHWLSCLRSA